MAPKSDNTKKTVAKKTAAQAKPTKKPTELNNDDELDEDDLEDIDDEIISKPSKSKGAGKSKSKAKDDDDDDAEDDVEVEDDWEKTEEDETWDPDFDEFDIPKSTTKKAGTKKADDDDLKLDEDFKEFGLFDDVEGGGTGFDDDDDF